jgi:hypothetical protein
VNDDLITRALSANADAIELRPGDPAAVMRRGSARRNRRRAAVGGLAVVAITATTFSVASRDPSNDVESSDTAAVTVVDSPFDWTVVTPQTALGFSNQSSVVDGVVYRLSTAPAPAVDDTHRTAPHLYRSADGAEWSEVSMPDGIAPVSLAGSDGVLYAVGTAPAGGLAVAASRDGAASWSRLELPGDLADLAAEFPGEVYFSAPRVAALSATNVVASVEVSFHPDLESRLPGQYDPELGASATEEGATLFKKVPCDEGMPDRGCASSEPPAATNDPKSGSGDTFGWGEGASYTWEQLGVDARLVDLLGGRTFAFASTDGVSFQVIDGLPTLAGGWASHLLAADGVYTLITGGDGSGTNVLKSVDGRSWTVSAELAGAVPSAGLLGGRVAIALFNDSEDVPGVGPRTLVEIEQPDGTFAPFDLQAGSDEDVSLDVVSFGPLGVAAVGYGSKQPILFHSTDGSTTSAVSLGDHVAGNVNVMGVDVTADAIAVRLARPVDGDGKRTGPQQVLVGTPR